MVAYASPSGPCRVARHAAVSWAAPVMEEAHTRRCQDAGIDKALKASEYTQIHARELGSASLAAN